MYHLTKTSSDHRHQEQPLSHHQLIRWPLKQSLLRPAQSTPTGATSADVLQSLQRALRRTVPGGPPGGGGAGGAGPPGGGAPAPPADVPQQPAQPPQDVKMMGALPAIFAGNCEQADNFIEQLKGYIRLNRLVPGMNSYIQRVALALTLIQGPLVAEW